MKVRYLPNDWNAVSLEQNGSTYEVVGRKIEDGQEETATFIFARNMDFPIKIIRAFHMYGNWNE